MQPTPKMPEKGQARYLSHVGLAVAKQTGGTGESSVEVEQACTVLGWLGSSLAGRRVEPYRDAVEGCRCQHRLLRHPEEHGDMLHVPWFLRAMALHTIYR